MSPTQIKAVSETINYKTGKKERIDQYTINNDNYTLKSRISIEDENNILYQESIDGVMRTVWSIETEYDETGRATVTNGFSHNHHGHHAQRRTGYRTCDPHLQQEYI